MSCLKRSVTLFVGVGLLCAVSDAATPRNLQDIFIGRCNEYQQVLYPQWMEKQKNCTDLWLKFYRSFAYKDPCSLDVNSYSEFVQAARHNIVTKDKVMYWSGQVTPLVYEFTARARRYVTIREYLAGYPVQDVYEWCGKVESELDGPGMDFESCPAWGSCGSTMPASEAFWKALSKDFAYIVQGDVSVLLNGSSGQAYRNYSTFGAYELPNLNATKNPVLHVKLIHNIVPIAGTNTETCQNGTLLQLKKDVEKMGIVYNCTDDPLDLLYFQCVDYVGAPKCSSSDTSASARSAASTSSATSLMRKQHDATLISVALLFVCRQLFQNIERLMHSTYK